MGIGELVFPQWTYCIVCGKYIDDTRRYALCDHCIKHMNFGVSEFDYGFAAMGYGLYERRLIFNLKYDGKTYIAPILADIIYDALYSNLTSEKCRDLLKADLVMPVPLHPNRLRDRGFNQSEKIAKHLCKKLGIPLETKALIRIKDTHTQRALSKKDRKLNMEGVFDVPKLKKSMIKDKNIILIDDIYTTGATIDACSKILKENGAKKIYALTLLFAGNRHHLMIE